MEAKNVNDAMRVRIKQKLDPKIRAGTTKASIALQKTIANKIEYPEKSDEENIVKAENLSDSDYETAVKESVESAVDSSMEDYIILIEEIIKEIKTNAEIKVTSGDLNMDIISVKSTIPIGAYSQGAGAAAAPSLVPMTISGNVDDKKVSGTIKKGSII